MDNISTDSHALRWSEPCVIDITKVCDPRGNLSFIQDGAELPFDIARVYWLYDVPGGRWRDGHAFRTGAEIIICLSGSFDVTLDRGAGSKKTIRLFRPDRGLYVPPMTWRAIDGFATNSVALFLASTPYDETDYIRSYETFKRLV